MSVVGARKASVKIIYTTLPAWQRYNPKRMRKSQTHAKKSWARSQDALVMSLLESQTMSSSGVSGSGFRGVSIAVFRRERKSLLFFVAVTDATVLVTFQLPKQYRSTAKLFVRLGRENATIDSTATLGQTPGATTASSTRRGAQRPDRAKRERAAHRGAAARRGPVRCNWDSLRTPENVEKSLDIS